MKFAVSDEAFQYLSIQRSGIYNLRDKRAVWEAALSEAVEQDFETMLPLLPARPRDILDVGGGLGVLAARLAHHYAECEPMIDILDGIDNPAEVLSHWAPFSNSVVATKFLHANGAKKFGFVSPRAGALPGRYDLVVSTQAWCFHIPPKLYLTRVKHALAPGAILILDVRRERGWMEELHKHFEVLGGLAYADKWARVAFMKREEI
jgi:SAM-dependent methyltransferase